MDILFDTNLLSHHLLTDAGAHDLVRVHRAVELGRFRVIVTWPLREEVLATHYAQPEKAKAMAALLYSLGEGRLLRSIGERWDLEIKLGRKLTSAEVFHPLSASQALVDSLGDEAIAKEGSEMAYNRKLRDEEEQTQLSAKILARTGIGPGSWPTIPPDWLPATAEDFARSTMEQAAKDAGVPLERVAQMNPRNLPSFWRRACIYLVISARNHSRGRIRPSDHYDQLHFIDAGYADMLVTEDRQFREAAAATGIPGQVFGLDDERWRGLLSV